MTEHVSPDDMELAEESGCWTRAEWALRQATVERPATHVVHESCSYACGGVFRCARCNNFYGWCCGATDGEHNDWCNLCVMKGDGK